MKTSQLDLGLALAAVARGYSAKTKQHPNESIILGEDGFILHKERGRDCRIENSALWLEWSTEAWYLVPDEADWIDKPVKT